MEENNKDFTEEVEEVVNDAPKAEEAPVEEAPVDAVQEEAPVEEAPVEEAPATETMTAEEFEAENSVDDNSADKKEKKPMSPKKKRNIIIISVVVAVIIAIVGTVCGLLFGGPKLGETVLDAATIVTSLPKDVFTNAAGEQIVGLKYVVGNENSVDLAKALPKYKEFASDDTAKGAIDGTTLTATADFVMTAKDADGNTVNFGVVVMPAVNVYTESELRAAIGDSKSAIMHQDIKTEGTESFELKKGVTLYGNAHTIYGDSIAAPKNQDKDSKTSWGSTLVALRGGATIEEVHLIMNTVEGEITLDDFEFTGTGIDVNADVVEDSYEMSYITNCIVQNGQKLINVYCGNVTIKGTICMYGADANIASGTHPDKPGSNITIENCVSAYSMVAGFLFYGFEGKEVPKGDTYHQQTLTIKGFFDIYNWKETSEAKLVPATEGKFIADTVNKNVVKEVGNKKFAKFLYDYKDAKYVHIGIIRLSTGNCWEQDPAIYYVKPDGTKVGGKRADVNSSDDLYPQFSVKSFPLPGWVTNILKIVKVCDMIGYKNQSDYSDGEVPYILPDSTIPANIMDHLRYGRNANNEPNVPAVPAK